MSRIVRSARLFGVMMVLGALVALASAAPAAATVKSTSGITGWNLSCFDAICWSGRAHFYAKWDRAVVYSEGAYSYWFTNFHVSGGIEVGDDCPIDVCTNWFFMGTVEFKNAAGNTLKTVFPNGSGCYAEAWPGDWVIGTKCKTSFEVPYAATKVKVTWLFQSIAPDNGVSGNWQTSSTVAI